MKESTGGAWVLPILKDVEAYLRDARMMQSAALVSAAMDMVAAEQGNRASITGDDAEPMDHAQTTNVLRFVRASRTA